MLRYPRCFFVQKTDNTGLCMTVTELHSMLSSFQVQSTEQKKANQQFQVSGGICCPDNTIFTNDKTGATFFCGLSQFHGYNGSLYMPPLAKQTYSSFNSFARDGSV